MLNDLIKNLSNSSDYTAALTTILVLIFILIMYLIVFKIGVYGIGKFMDWKGDPYIFHGMVSAPLETEYSNYQYIHTNPMDQKKSSTLDQDDNTKSIVILRSKDERNGIEFTWSLWIYVDADGCMKQLTNESSCGLGVDRTNTSAEIGNSPDSLYKRNVFHIFNKGSHIHNSNTNFEAVTTTSTDKDIEEGMAVMTCPGLYLRYNDEIESISYQNELKRRELRKMVTEGKPYDALNIDDKNRESDDDLRNSFEYVITCNTASNVNLMETVTVPNIPVNLWTYVTIRCVNHKLDVYINGRIKKRTVFKDLPRQNYGDLNICEKLKKRSSGKITEFTGKLSGMRYFNYALQGRTIEYFTEKGPSTKPEKVDKNNKDGKPYYLTQRWHYQDYMR